jgi:hypothetical protein
MKKLLLLLLFSAFSLHAQTIIQRDNGKVAGYYISQNSFEESVLLKPDGPCKVNKVQVYFGGSNAARKDTILIVGDPAEGAIPPTQYVWSYNTLATAIVDYNGTPGWYTIDLSALNIRSDGFDRICVQHTNEVGGPRFGIDDDGASKPNSSFLYDPIKINTLNFPGIYSLTQGDFMVRLEVTYDFPEGNSSKQPPYPSLLDITKQAKLVASNGEPVKSARVSVADWNNDGFDDVAIGGNFFENQKDGTFKDVSNKITMSASATVWGDYNNDGWLDVYVVNGAGDRIYRNNGNGTFTNITDLTGFSNPMPTVTPIWLDYDRDGNLDIFIANGRTESAGSETYYPDQLWKNNGDGTFKNVTNESKIALGEPQPLDCWGATAADYNNDGFVDIFVATYRLAPDKLFKNNGDGTFTEVGAETGVRGNPTASPQYFGHGIGCDWGDYDNDGFLDLAVGNLGHPDWRGAVSNPSLVFKNNGGENFTEVHKDLGIKFFEMNSGVMWADLDLDGNLDLWHSQYAYEPVSETSPQRLSRVYMNGGSENNYAFKDKTWELGAKIHGAWTQARLDFDNDGDIDILAASPHDGVRLFRNDMERKGNWIGFRLGAERVSYDSNKVRNIYDVVITLYEGKKTFQRKLLSGGSGSTATQHSNMIHFGLGDIEIIDSAVVSYKGKQRTFRNLSVNSCLYLGEDTTGLLKIGNQKFATPALQFPKNNAQLTGTDVDLLWANEGYYIMLSKDTTFTSQISPTWEGITHGKLQGRKAKNLPENTRIYWRVMQPSTEVPRESSWSSVWSFTTGNSTSVENETALENNLLKEATPNPVFEITRIDFTVEKSGAVSLKIFDLSGKEIATLADGNFEPGNYSRTWNAENVESGTYYYVLKTAAGSVSKKLVVQK